MFTSPLIRTLVAGMALQLCAAAAFAQASGISCQVSSDGMQTTLADGLDDLGVGTLSAPLTRTCPSDSVWPDGTYTVTTNRGALRVADTFGSPDFHSITTTNRNAGIVFGDFASNANSFYMVIHGADKDGNFVKNTKMHIRVMAVDGSVLWSKHFLVNGSPYSLGLSGPSAIATVELKRVGTQPNGVDESYPVVDVFGITHDSSYGTLKSVSETRRFAGEQ